jgi:hypothetical protein
VISRAALAGTYLDLSDKVTSFRQSEPVRQKTAAFAVGGYFFLYRFLSFVHQIAGAAFCTPSTTFALTFIVAVTNSINSQAYERNRLCGVPVNSRCYLP